MTTSQATQEVISLTSFNDVRERLILEHEIRNVIDVGANNGSFVEGIRRFFSGSIYSLEPATKPFRKLSSRAREDARWKCLKLAAFDRRAILTLNLSVNHVFNSLFEIQETASSIFGKTCLHTEAEEVQGDRLDRVFKNLAGATFLKLDTQGSEVAALKGAAGLIKHVDLVQVELSLIPIYYGAPNSDAVLRVLDNYGFKKLTQTPVNTDKLGNVIEVDALFYSDRLSF